MQIRPLFPLALLALFAASLTGCRPSSSSTSGPPPEVVAAVNRGVSQMGQYQYEAAVQSFEQAAKAMPDNTEVQVNLAIALFNRGKRELGDLDRPVQMLDEVLKKDPGNVRARYFLGIIHTHLGKAELAVPCFEWVTRQQTNDGVAWYLLGLARHRIGQPAQKEFLRAVELRPNLYSAWYKLGQTALAAGDEAKGTAFLDKFKLLRESPAGESIEIPQYGQMGELALVRSLGGESGVPAASAYRVGKPTTVFAPDANLDSEDGFAETALGDFNSDGWPDLVVAASRKDARFGVSLLLGSGGGRFRPPSSATGLEDVRGARWFAVGDFDNDGLTDLFVVCRGANRLFKGKGDGSFLDVTAQAGVGVASSEGGSALLVDMDHDGDLDLFVCGARSVDGRGPTPNQLWRNNGDGKFTDIADSAGVACAENGASLALPGDVDGDRDLDLVVLVGGRLARIFLNDLSGRFTETASGLPEMRGFRGASLEDFNADGTLDLLVLGKAAPNELKLFIGDGKGKFSESLPFNQTTKGLAAEPSRDRFRVADLDLDGDLDILVFASGVFPLINDGHGTFVLQPSVAKSQSWAGAEVADVNGDRVPDLLLTELFSKSVVTLALGELPRTATAVAIQPSGIRSRDGRTRSPASGYGVTLTARAGLREAKLYYTGLNGGPNQSSVPAVLGLGGAREADYVHLFWPDGVMQIETNLAAGQIHKISELQRKISSCPVLFTWNGERFEFVTDFAGVGGLGYYVSPGLSAPPQVLEHVKIEPTMLRAKDGVYELRITEPMEETAYVDRLELLAIDHATDQAVFPDERLAITGRPPTHEMLVVEKPIFPVKAIFSEAPPLPSLSPAPSGGEGVRRTGEGAAGGAEAIDCTDRLARIDRVYAYTPPLDRRYIGFCAPHTLELDFGDRLAGIARTNRLFLFLHGFIEYPYSQTIFAASQSRVGWEPIRIEQQQPDGSWKTIVADAGAFGGMARMMTVELTGQVGGPRCRLRLTTNMELFYDQVFLAQAAPTNSVMVQSVPLKEAVLRRVGFAREVSPDGREPLIYDYQQSDATAPFHVLRGAYTRFGDVKELLGEFDDRYVLIGPGEEVALKFDAVKLPPPVGRTRSFILVSHAYCKDMDLYTATPQTLEPLPFRAMSQYPYPAAERFPDAPEHRDWQKTYNTRMVP